MADPTTKYQLGDVIQQWVIIGLTRKPLITVYYLENKINGTKLTLNEDTMTRLFSTIPTQSKEKDG